MRRVISMMSALMNRRCWAAVLLGLFAVGAAWGQNLAGTWQGTMQVGKEQRMVVKIAKDAGADGKGWCTTWTGTGRTRGG